MKFNLVVPAFWPILAMGVLLLAERGNCFAATLTVTSSADSGAGTLRNLVASANPGDTIVFTNSLSGQTILLTNGPIVLSNTITIDGSALASPIQLNGNHTNGIFMVEATATLNSLIITNGYAGLGGGINCDGGGLTLNNSIVVNNFAPGGDGGGIYASHCTLTLNNSTVANNSVSQGNGGGIINILSSVTLNNSTVANNSALQGVGGGIFSNGGTVTLVNSTVASNSASGGFGGGIYNLFGAFTVTNATVAGNSAPGGDGGGIYNNQGTVTLKNTILSANSASVASNIDGNYSAVASLVDVTDILIAPLGYYGGPTMTMPPLPDSPAVDAGSDSVTNFLTTDQRGFPRLAGAFVDIGAVEGVYIANFAGPGRLTGASRPANSSGAFQFGFTNYPDISFTVWASSNSAQPFKQWLKVGAMVASPPGSGQYQFTDTSTANSQQRFYRVTSP